VTAVAPVDPTPPSGRRRRRGERARSPEGDRARVTEADDRQLANVHVDRRLVGSALSAHKRTWSGLSLAPVLPPMANAVKTPCAERVTLGMTTQILLSHSARLTLYRIKCGYPSLAVATAGSIGSEAPRIERAPLGVDVGTKRLSGFASKPSSVVRSADALNQRSCECSVEPATLFVRGLAVRIGLRLIGRIKSAHVADGRSKEESSPHHPQIVVAKSCVSRLSSSNAVVVS